MEELIIKKQGYNIVFKFEANILSNTMCRITSLVFALSQLLAEVGVKARVAVVLPQFGTESLVKKISRCVGWSNEKLEYVSDIS